MLPSESKCLFKGCELSYEYTVRETARLRSATVVLEDGETSREILCCGAAGSLPIMHPCSNCVLLLSYICLLVHLGSRVIWGKKHYELIKCNTLMTTKPVGLKPFCCETLWCVSHCVSYCVKSVFG